MSIYNWGLNNIFMNSFIPMPVDPFGGLNPFCTGFERINPFFNFMTPQINIFPTFQPFIMPSFISPNSIFTSMPAMNYSMPFMSNPFNYTLPPSVYTAGLEGLNIPAFGKLSLQTCNTQNKRNTQNMQNSQNTYITRNTYSDNRIQEQIKTQTDKIFQNTGKLDKHFLNRVKQIAKNLNCDYKDLLAVMNSESGLRTNAWNGSTAVGLIQFTDPAIQELNNRYGLNLTKAKIAKMTPIEQLDLTEKLLIITKSYKFPKNAKLSAADLYSIVFLPGRADRDILCRKGEAFYNQNKGLDKDGDGVISKSDLSRHLAAKHVDESQFV